jgi:hypothetical protein
MIKGNSIHPASVLLRESDFLNRVQLPSRVKWEVPMTIKTANIHSLPSVANKTQGLFVMKKVKTGELLFKIKRPLLAVVGGSKDAAASSCDNCFVTIKSEYNPIQKSTTVAVSDRKLEKCCGCKVVYYCNKECQKKAWAHHHKYECKTLATIRADAEALHMNTQQSTVISPQLVSTVRILQLLQNNQITDLEWNEFIGLPVVCVDATWRKEILPEYIMYCTKIALCMHSLLKTALSHREICVLQLQMVHNKLDVRVPVTKAFRDWWDPESKSVEVAGFCVDPFVSNIRHSCDNNATYTFR